MSKRFILALDQGTTSSRALLVDHDGKPCGVASEEFPQHYPQPGWVEHDPLEIWRSQERAMRRLLAEKGVTREEIAAIGLTNQRETTLLWRRSDGAPVAPALVWQDRRTSPRCEELRQEGRNAWLRERTGLLLDPYFSATKLEWLFRHDPDLHASARKGELAFGTVDAWLLWYLTGGREHRTDRTNASRTLLWNLREEHWDPALLELFGIPSEVLPEVAPSIASFGECTLPGLEGLPVCGIAGDQQAALFGQGGWAEGLAKNTYGTGCFLLLNAGFSVPAPPTGILATAACAAGTDAAYALEGSVFVAGAAVQWLRDGLGLIATAAETEALARSVPDTGGVTLVPAFTGLGAPYWDAEARGTITGITRGTTRAHLVRAALEAIAHQTADLVEAMTADCGLRLEALRVDGGASANNFLMQFQADLLGLPVERAAVTETTALGAAYLAGLGAGLWTPQTLARQWRRDRLFEPTLSTDQRATHRAAWRSAVDQARHRSAS